MMNVSNVVQFNTPTDKNVFTCIDTFLKRVNQNSNNTKAVYEKAIRDFFVNMRNKNIEDLVEKDLIFTKEQIECYQVNLKESGYSSTTVNTKMSALKKCYTKLEDYGFDVQAKWFNLERYNDSDKVSYSSMSKEEVVECIKLVSKTREGNQKALLIRLAFATAFRKESLLNLKWSDFSNVEDVWIAKTLGKGKKWDYKKISNELYSDLLERKNKINANNNGKVFTLTEKTVDKMMKYIKDNIDFGDRSIVFHSFKKSSVNEVALITNNDLKAMQRQGNHSSVTTTLNDYMDNKKLEDLVIIDTSENHDINELNDLSKDELISLIKKCDRVIQIRLLQNMKKYM